MDLANKDLKQVEGKNEGIEGVGKGLDSSEIGVGIGDTLATCVKDMELCDDEFIFSINMRVREFVHAILINFVRIHIFLF